MKKSFFCILFVLISSLSAHVFAAPTSAPATPAQNPNTVISYYGYYNDIYGLGNPAFSMWGFVGDPTPEGYLKPSSGGGVLNLGSRTSDLSGMILHIDVWGDATDNMTVQFMDWAGSGGTERKTGAKSQSITATGSWTSVDIPLTEANFSGLSTTFGNSMQAIIISGTSIYVTNVYIYDPNYDPASAPQIKADDPTNAPGDVYSVFNDNPFGVSNGTGSSAWNGTLSKYILGPGESAHKIIIAGQGTVEYLFSDSPSLPDVSSYTHIHFDIWSESGIPSNELMLALYDAGGQDADRSEGSVNAVAGGAWTGVDMKLSSFTKGNLAATLAALKKIRFETVYGTSGDKTYYVDNIYFYTVVTDPSVPSAPAFLPPALSSVWGAENVKSVFSDSYTNEAGTPSFSPSGDPSYVLQNNNIWKFASTTSVTMTLASSLDISAMTNVHLDVWTQNATDVTLKLNNIEASSGVKTSIAGNWLRIDIPLSEFGALAGSVNTITVSGTGEARNYYIDNIYFYKHLDQFEIADIHEYNASLVKGINLGDIFDFDGNNWNAAYIGMVKDKGFSHVRLPVRWESYNRSMTEAPYNITPEFIRDIIKPAVDDAIDKGMKIMINMHHHDEFSADPAGQLERFKAQWTQIAEYFRYYPDNLIFEVFNEPNYNGTTQFITPEVWNSVLVEGVNTIRLSNPNRAVMIGVAGGGGLSALSKLDLLSEENIKNDQNLIVTIHYYSPQDFTHQGTNWGGTEIPLGAEWLDTETERNAVNADFQTVTSFLQNNNRPIHIGEFGAIGDYEDNGTLHEGADMDSRVRWTTYVARYIEKMGYSGAYWDFNAKFGVYDPKEGVYRTPLVNALLVNPIPEKPALAGTAPVEPALYDSNVNGTAGWSVPGTFSKSNNQISGPVTAGGNSWDIQPYLPFNYLVKGSKYVVTFTASVTNEGSAYGAYVGHSTLYTQYGYIHFAPTTLETEYSFSFTMPDNTGSTTRLAFDLGGQNTNTSIIIKDVLIQEVVDVAFEPAPVPTLLPAKVDDIYSSVYTESSATKPTFSDTGNAEFIADNNGGDIIRFTNFDTQVITLPTQVKPAENKLLHLNAYAGSPMDLNVEVSDGTATYSGTYPLGSHGWTTIVVDLTSFLSASSTGVKTITLSGGTGKGRKLYIDHMYVFSSNKSIWNGAIDGDWLNPNNWNGVVPDKTIDVHLPGNASVYPVLQDANAADYMCKDIYFMYGAQLGRSDLLDYDRAYVQMNMGLGSQAQQESEDIEDYLSYSAKYSATAMARNRWYMLTMPLSGVFSGDLTFGGYPGTYLRKFDASKSVSGNILKANWSEYFRTTTEELSSGEGFIFWMNAYQNVWPNMEYGSGDKEFGLQQINGIVQLPYYADEDMSRGHRIHEYDADSGISTFYMFNSEGDLSGKAETVTRDDNKSYRFIYESNAEAPDMNYTVTKPAEGNLALVGNPYMSSIDFDKFYEDNASLIKPLYQLWTGNVFTTYDVPSGETAGDVNNDINRLIAPMQSFLVQLADDFPEGSADLIFNMQNVTPADLTSTLALKSGSNKQTQDLFTITASNNKGATKTFIAKRADGSSLYSAQEGDKIISTVRSVPDVYLLKQVDEVSTSLRGIPYAIVGDVEIEIPLALATSTSGSTTFTFAGMDQYDAEVTFIDLEKGIYQPITGMPEYEYDFDFTPVVSNGNYLSQEDRFKIRLSSKVVGVEKPGSVKDTWIYTYQGSLNIMTTTDNQIQGVNIYDIQGRTLFKDMAIDKSFYQIQHPVINNSVRIVEVITNKGIEKFKIIL